MISDAQTQIMEALKPYLVEKYNGTFTEEEIQDMLSSVHFNASTNVDEQQKKNPILQPPYLLLRIHYQLSALMTLQNIQSMDLIVQRKVSLYIC